MSTQAPTTPPDAGSPVPAPVCPTCSAPLAADQRYCLNCGHRLTDPRVEYSEALRLEAPPIVAVGPAGANRDPRNALVVLAGLATIVLAVGVGIVIGRGNGTATPAKPTVVTVSAAPTPTTAAGTGVPATSTPVTATKVTDDWPAGASGWTVEVSSLDTATATAADVTAAVSAAGGKGATAVGVLNGNDHGGTPIGKFVIYSGRFTSKTQAQTASHRLAKKFPGALVLHVTPKHSGSAGGGSSSTGSAHPSASVKQAAHLSGAAYEKASAKLPNQVSTGGKAPPVDHKKAGGGTPSTCIGC